MKRISILLFLLTIVNSTFAQSIKKQVDRFGMHSRIINALLQPQQGTHKLARKTTSGVTMERVIAQSTKDNTAGSLNDSVNLKYGAGRGSNYDYNTMIFPYNYPYNTSPMFNYAGVFTKPQVLFDTLRHWTVDPNTLAYGYYETDLAGYDAVQNINNYVALYADSSFYPNMIYSNTFTWGHNITKGYSSNWISGAVDSAFKQFFTYNTSNYLIADSTYELHLGVWRLGSASKYTYDGANNLIQIDNYTNATDTSFLLPLVERLQYINTYDASNRLLTVEANYHYNVGLSAYTRDTFGYTGTYPFHTAWREHQFDTINSYWAPMFNMTKTIGGLGLPDTVSIQGFDSLLNSWIPQTRYVMHYNASNDPDTLKDYEYNYTFWPATPNFTTKYYYQSYVNTLGVNEIASVVNDVKIFPNPATRSFTITQLNVPANTPITVTLMNVSGQAVSRERMHWNGDAQLDISYLKPGVYWILIQDAAGNMLHRQAVVKS